MKKTMLIAIMAIATILMTSQLVVYADEFIMPFGTKHLVDFWVEIIFNPVDTGGVDVRVVQTSLFHYDNIIEMPDQFVVTHEMSDGGAEKQIVVVKQIWENMIAPLPEPEIKQAITGITPETQARLDAKRAELEERFKEALFCKYGEGAESVFQAKMEVIRLKEMEYFKHLPGNYQTRALILATEACDAFQGSYLYRYAEYAGMFEGQKTDIVPFVLDETDSPHTDPVTQRDLDKAAQRAADLPKKYNDPYKEFSGENRGGFSAGKECDIRPVAPGLTVELMCPMASLNSYLTTTPTKEQQWATVQQLVCDTYLMVHYTDLVERILAGDEKAELPHWLNHCELTS